MYSTINNYILHDFFEKIFPILKKQKTPRIAVSSARGV